MQVSNKFLQDLVSQYDAMKVAVRTVADDLTEEQFNQRPEKNRWSVGECIEHLNTSYAAYNPIIKNIISCSINDSVNNPDDYKIRLHFKIFCKWLEPPYKMKIKTFDIFTPDERLNKEETTNQFITNTDEFINFIKQSEKVDLKKTIITSPVTDKLKFRLGELFPFMAAHIRRHIWQAESVKKLIS